MENGKGKLKIGRPYIEEREDHMRLCVAAEIEGGEHLLWFAVGKQYGEYLTEERADPFVAALLPTALRTGADIICESPVTKRLLYQVNHYLIPMLAANLPGLCEMKVLAEPAEAPLACTRGVATGWTGGIDSMFTLMKHVSAIEPHYRLTHLLVMGNGAVVGSEAHATLKEMVRRAEQGIAAKLDGQVAVVGMESNLQEIIPENFMEVQGFRLASAVLVLQKLFGVYLHSSSYCFAEFGFDPQSFCRYELAVLQFLGTDNTTFYSAGGAYTRRYKLEQLADYPLAHKYLHPCVIAKGRNCGRCPKCVWVETMLYALGKLDAFAAVFDVGRFKREKEEYKKMASHLGDPFLSHILSRRE